jgi:RNA polymerase sigma factor for flagellar operon FliA
VTPGTQAPAPLSSVERDRLVEQYLPLVRHVLGRLPVTIPASLDREDLLSVGVFGLIHAASSYDPTRGASFKTFAFTAIRGSILDELRRHDPVPRSKRDKLKLIDKATLRLRGKLARAPNPDELAAELKIPLADLERDLLALRTVAMLSLDEPAGEETLGASMSISRETGPLEAASGHEMAELLAAAIGELPDTERKVVILYYHDELLLREIGDVLGVTESRISQILTGAIARLRSMMKEKQT